MGKIITLGLALAAAVTLFMVQPARAAEDVFKDICDQNAASSSAACESEGGNPLTGPDGVITRISTAVAIVAGILAVAIIIWGGFSYITSGGDSSKTTNARNMITYAVIGLVVIVVAQTIIAFVLSRL